MARYVHFLCLQPIYCTDLAVWLTKTYWTIVFSVEIHFGLTEFRARIKWTDNVRRLWEFDTARVANTFIISSRRARRNSKPYSLTIFVIPS